MSRQSDIERLAKFMGWEKIIPGARVPLKNKFFTSCGRVFHAVGKKNWEDFVEFNPFNSLDDAMLVANKLGNVDSVEAWMFTFTNWRYYGDGTYRAVFYNSHLEKSVDAEEKTLSEAIAVAALAALGYLDGREKRK